MTISSLGSSHAVLWLPEPEGGSFHPRLRPLTHGQIQNQLVGKLVIDSSAPWNKPANCRSFLSCRSWCQLLWFCSSGRSRQPDADCCQGNRRWEDHPDDQGQRPVRGVCEAAVWAWKGENSRSGVFISERRVIVYLIASNHNNEQKIRLYNNFKHSTTTFRMKYSNFPRGCFWRCFLLCDFESDVWPSKDGTSRPRTRLCLRLVVAPISQGGSDPGRIHWSELASPDHEGALSLPEVLLSGALVPAGGLDDVCPSGLQNIYGTKVWCHPSSSSPYCLCLGSRSNQLWFLDLCKQEWESRVQQKTPALMLSSFLYSVLILCDVCQEHSELCFLMFLFFSSLWEIKNQLSKKANLKPDVMNRCSFF